MAKSEFPRLQTRVSPELKQIFERFIDTKGMVQTEFMEKYLPAVMIAEDKELYIEICIEVYGIEKVKEVIAKLEGRDSK